MFSHQKIKPIVIILTASLLVGGCTDNSVPPTPATVSSLPAETTAVTLRPKPDDIAEFKADPFNAGNQFKDFKVDREYLEDILLTWHQVSQGHWLHGYSHVAFGDRTGTIKLKDGTIIRWMVRPGGLATLTFKDQKVLYLARELTPWKEQGLQLSCSMVRTEFTIGQKLPPPTVTLCNNTDTDLDLIGPTIAVIECTLVQPDKAAVTMCIAMPTGRDPRQMPTRKLKAATSLELKPDGIWYYEDASGFEPYIFHQQGFYEFKCKYEDLNSNIITITVKNNACEQTSPGDDS